MNSVESAFASGRLRATPHNDSDDLLFRIFFLSLLYQRVGMPQWSNGYSPRGQKFWLLTLLYN